MDSRGIWMSRSLSSSFLKKTRRPEEYLITKLFLSLMAVVGFLFFLIVLLHLIYSLDKTPAFYAYLTLFIVLELIVIAGWLYINFHERSSSPPFSNDNNDEVEEVRDSSVKQDV